jgi:hypothetical protein
MPFLRNASNPIQNPSRIQNQGPKTRKEQRLFVLYVLHIAHILRVEFLLDFPFLLVSAPLLSLFAFKKCRLDSFVCRGMGGLTYKSGPTYFPQHKNRNRNRSTHANIVNYLLDSDVWRIQNPTKKSQPVTTAYEPRTKPNKTKPK